ncbi:UMP kinase [Candidatus Beckwithbacteria bacterium CG10_big_fil_rev_8_21_14_0_10_34_10]|uniref:Uridylate kinase n=1 Tax=Candidatus Beckwithbacteria bacterium CG10_big_fil_rev_8_21_14_0_10_34_10 TaxID=1974495 RepID=A0A2H0W7Y0_9BACT|nr:MAG: UMP kinase [Candidatus Beckwithbacteria bacterium CG10_big_fil_rev_8_21_14_0_10_34_10]
MIVKNNKRYILSLGGSLIVPNGGIDVDFLKRFNQYIRKKVAQGCHFFIVTGGGASCRHYRDAAAEVCGKKITRDDLDWLGVHSSRLNGHLIRTIFQDIAYKHVIKHYDMVDKKAVDEKIVIGVGWKPGWSTDYDAVLLAQDYQVDKVINLTSIDMVYDKDPTKFKDAKPVKKISWNEMTDIVGSQWKPGLNAPFDPIASQLANKIRLKVIVCNGRNIENLDNIIEGKKFIGTVIQ